MHRIFSSIKKNRKKTHRVLQQASCQPFENDFSELNTPRATLPVQMGAH
jgi:hypothetical protein